MKHNLLFTLILSIGFLFQGSLLFAQNDLKDSKADAIEDFETGDFSQYEWTFAGQTNWSVVDVDPHEGSYAAQSGLITHNQSSQLQLVYEVYAADTLSFWYKVSSEPNYDYLVFYIDGAVQDEWAGAIGWTKAEYVVGAGAHTFKWAYEKDGSVNTGQDAAWIDYITFPPMEIEAGISSDNTVICVNDIVQFFDESVGPVNQWSWIFEGGTPFTSTAQNPVVGYSTPGSYGVLLEVSDGIETASQYIENYITVGTTPSSPGTPTGISLLCASWGNSTYSVNALPGISNYNWTVTPSSAGTISGNGGTSATVIWTPDFLGTAQLRVAGVNYCGTGSYSNPINITRYLPEVSLMLTPYVGLPDPPFALSGGLPAGGTYSGPGVSNGIFDPAVAGLGDHTITYTYSDLSTCTNSAEDIITVTPYSGIQPVFGKEGVYVYPNPSTGNFTLRLNIGNHSNVSIRVFDAMNKQFYSEQNRSIDSGHEVNFAFENLAEGIYFVRVASSEFSYNEKLIIKK